MKQNYHAITLDKIDIGEADRLYTFYTLEKGLVRVPARSVRKNNAKLTSQIEDFVLSHITIAQNYGRGTLTGAVGEKYFEYLRGDYNALVCVDRARSTVLAVIDENQIDKNVFLLLVEYLRHMDEVLSDKQVNSEGMQLEWITYVFLIKFFALQGYEFQLTKCSECKNKIKETKNCFSVSSGGIVCKKCNRDKYFSYVDPDTLKALRIIKNNHLDKTSKLLVNENVIVQLKQIVDNIERWIMR